MPKMNLYVFEMVIFKGNPNNLLEIWCNPCYDYEIYGSQ